jgi:3-oxoacyl-[acyl-carrier protein] reductase
MNLKLEGKRALITGGSAGIGYATAEQLALEGAYPTIVGRCPDRLRLAKQQCFNATGHDISIISLDLSKQGSAKELADKVGAVDILVNCAGAIPVGNLAQVLEDTWRDAWDLKVYSYINLTRELLPKMETRGSGVIANVIGIGAQMPRWDYICGSTANAALSAFTKAAGAQSQKAGVRVFGVNPSRTRTDRVEQILRYEAHKKLRNQERWRELIDDLPFNRLIEPAEVANLIVFGCSNAASPYLSGTVIDLDGGRLYT